MADDFYPFVAPGSPVPDNSHITGATPAPATDGNSALPEDSANAANGEVVAYATRIAIYDDMYSTPRVVVIEPGEVRAYLEEVTNTVYRCMKEQGGKLSLMVIREIVENFIHAHFVEPIISILDGGNTIRFADQGPGIENKERAFEFGVTSANRSMKRFIRGTGAGFPMVQQYLEAAGGAVSIEDNLGAGTVVTVSVDANRVLEIKGSAARGASVRGANLAAQQPMSEAMNADPYAATAQAPYPPQTGMAAGTSAPAMPTSPWTAAPVWQQGAAAPYAGQQPYPMQQYTYLPDGYVGAGSPYPATMCPPAGMQQTDFQQPHHEFSTNQQFPGQQPWQPSQQTVRATGNPAVVSPGTPGNAQVHAVLSERCQRVLMFIGEHGAVGPKELCEAYGHSNSTWSRALGTLSEQGFITKQGQKHYLTERGAAWVSAQQGMGN